MSSWGTQRDGSPKNSAEPREIPRKARLPRVPIRVINKEPRFNQRARPMSEFKFACPSCQQRIAADATWSGQQIQCPACKAQIAVPAAPAPAPSQAPAAPTPPPKGRLSVSSHAPAAEAPPPPSPVPAGGPARPMKASNGSSAGKTVGIAIACVVVVAGAAFGVMKIRAHKAEAKAAEDAAAKAKEAAAVAAAAENTPKTGSVNTPKAATAAAATASDTSSATPAVSAATRRAVSEAESRYGKSTQPASPGDEGVAPDPSQIPETPVAGMVQNEPFKITSASYQAGWLTLGEGSGAIPDRSVKFNLYVPSTESIEGRTFKRPDPKERRPLSVTPKGKRMPGSPATTGYALQMEFGKKQGNQIPGKLFLSIPGTVTNQIAGTFKVDLK